MNYVVFCKPSCPYCVKAIDLLRENNKTFKMINFNEKDTEILQEVKSALEWQTVPMVFLKEGDTMKLLGGYTELLKQLEDA